MEQERKWPWGKLAGEGKGKREKNQVKLRDNLCRLALSLAVVVVVVEFLSHARFFVTPRTAACQALLSPTISWSLLKFMSIATAMLSNHLILCHPVSFCLQSFPASESFPVIWLFTSGGQRIGASASASVLSVNIQSWFPSGLTGLILLFQHHS